MIKNKKLTLIVSILVVIALILHPVLTSATTEQDLKLLHIKNDEVFHYNYKEDIKNNIEQLMLEVDTLESNYDKELSKSILEETFILISEIPLEQMEGLDVSSMYFDKSNYPEDTIFYGNDQFSYVIFNTIYYSANHLSVKERDNFFIKLIDNLYLVVLNQLNNGSVHLETLKYITAINNIRDLFGIEVKTTLDKANVLIDKLVNFTENKSPDELKNSWTDYRFPSEFSKEELEDSEQEKEEIENNRQEDLETIDSNTTLEDFPKPDIPSQDTTTSPNSNSQNTNEDYLHKLGEDYATATKEEEKDSSIKNIYYTFDKSVENPIWNDSGISMEDGTVDCDKLFHVLSIIGRNDEYFYMTDTDMVMLIAEGEVLVLNKVETVTEDEINSLFDKFEKLGIKVMLKSDETANTNNSLTAKLEADEINTISVSGENLILTNKPILTKNMLQLPIKQVAETLGYEVTESGDTITLTYEIKSSETENQEETNQVAINKLTIVLTVGSQHYTVNDKKNSFKSPVTKEDGVIYSEFNTIAEKLGYKMIFDSDSGIIEFEN